jgi:hypothetical protein
MCRKGSPKQPAEIIRRGNLPNSSATLTRRFYSPEISAIATRGIDLPENPPSTLRILRQDPARQPPPPLTPRNGGGGRGCGTDPTRPDIANRYFSFPLHIILHIPYDTTYTHSTQSGSMNESITILLSGEGNDC